MENTRQILVAKISVAIFLQATKAYYDKNIQKDSGNYKNDFTDLGEDALNKHIWKCYLPLSKMGKSREINTIEASNLLENVKHIDDIHLIHHYKNIPLKKLEDIFITILFCNHENDEITERLHNALFIKSIIKPAAKNGSIDAIKLEVLLKKVLKGKKITDYINRSGKHPLVSFLEINPRTLKSFGGNKNENK